MDMHNIYKFFADYIYKNTGMSYTEADYYRLESRLKTMVNHFDVADAKAVYEMYAQNITTDMHTFLINLATNNETYFFRDAKPFKALTEEAIPALEKIDGLPRGLKIWSAGCSAGQEVYSILMSIKNSCSPDMFKKCQITATDISTDMIKKSSGAIYNNLEVQRGLPIKNLMKHFDELENEEWKVKSDLTQKASFSLFNLLTDTFPIAKYHIVFCRNVLIYQKKENKQKIMQGIAKSLLPGGYLIMGAGESLIGLDVDLKQIKVKESMFFTHKDS